MADPVPTFLRFLPRVDEVRSAPGFEPDVAVIVDSGTWRGPGRSPANTRHGWSGRGS